MNPVPAPPPLGAPLEPKLNEKEGVEVPAVADGPAVEVGAPNVKGAAAAGFEELESGFDVEAPNVKGAATGFVDVADAADVTPSNWNGCLVVVLGADDDCVGAPNVNG